MITWRDFLLGVVVPVLVVMIALGALVFLCHGCAG